MTMGRDGARLSLLAAASQPSLRPSSALLPPKPLAPPGSRTQYPGPRDPGPSSQMQAVAIAEATPAGRDGRLAEGIYPGRSVRLGSGPAPISHQQTGIGQCQCKCHVMPCNPSRGPCWPCWPCWPCAPRVQFHSTIIMETTGPPRVEQLIPDCPVTVTPDQCGFKNERFSSLFAVCTLLCNIRLLIAARHGCKAHHASPDQPGQSSTLTCEPRTADNSSESPVPGTCLIIGRPRQSRPRPQTHNAVSKFVFLFPLPPCLGRFQSHRPRAFFDLEAAKHSEERALSACCAFQSRASLCQLVLRCTCQ